MHIIYNYERTYCTSRAQVYVQKNNFLSPQPRRIRTLSGLCPHSHVNFRICRNLPLLTAADECKIYFPNYKSTGKTLQHPTYSILNGPIVESVHFFYKIRMIQGFLESTGRPNGLPSTSRQSMRCTFGEIRIRVPSI